jgi:hypothetical protein
MASESDTPASVLPHRIELSLRDVGQLFNTMDPSPFHDKDLDHDAEEFIESWAFEFRVHEPVSLIVHLDELPAGPSPQPMVEQAVHNYFTNRARLNRLEFRRLMAEGRTSLIIGLLFLGACLSFSELVVGRHGGTLSQWLRESLTIGGWVAMWRPLEIYLYDWWPLRHRGKVYEKLSQMPVEVRRKG